MTSATIVEERPHARARALKFAPLDPAKPVTNKQLADQNAKLHECLHDVGKRVDTLAETVRQDREAASQRDQLQNVAIARIEGALGVDRDKVTSKTKLAGISPLKALGWLVGAITGIQVAYQIFAPPIAHFVVEVHHSLMGG